MTVQDELIFPLLPLLGIRSHTSHSSKALFTDRHHGGDFSKTQEGSEIIGTLPRSWDLPHCRSHETRDPSASEVTAGCLGVWQSCGGGSMEG